MDANGYRATRLCVARILVLTVACHAATLLGGGFAQSLLRPALAITLQEAEGILAAKVLHPSGSRKEVEAFLLPTPLPAGSVVERDRTDEPKSYPISAPSYFAFVDNTACAAFEHRVRYVFIDATTGKVKIKAEKWWPRVNGTSIYLLPSVRAYAQIAAPFPSSVTDDAGGPRGDFGDAPDGSEAYPGVPGKFPTRFATVNALLGRPGGHVATAGPDTLGRNVSKERGAADPHDADGVPNLVDADKDERMFFFYDDTGPSPKVRLAFDVTLRGARGVARYVNVLIDRNRDGQWSLSGAGDEWVVVNLLVGSTPGAKTVLTDEIPYAVIDPAWTRVALTRESIPTATFSGLGGWDGSGAFGSGEIEDLILAPDTCRDRTSPGLPPPGPPPPPPGPPPPPPPPPPPGGAGPGPAFEWGIPVGYVALIINLGDKPGDSWMQRSATEVGQALAGQGYTATSAAPGLTNMQICDLIGAQAAKVSCLDHLFIYIVGHGYKDGGIHNQATGMKMTPAFLAACLDQIGACRGEPCDTGGKSCHVTVVIDSCFSGNFLDPLSKDGRNIYTSSDSSHPMYGWGDGSSWYGGGLAKNLGDLGDDKNHDGSVGPSEAHASASKNVDDQHKKDPGSMPGKPKMSEGECPCFCPTCGNGDLDSGEDCDGGDCCTATCTFAPITTVCRSAAGSCDLTESCTGTSGSCPSDAKSTATCRPASDVCDVAESCDGIHDDCPADGFASTETICRPASGGCDVAEACTGSDATCPQDFNPTCVAPPPPTPTPPSCGHLNGLGQTYTDCPNPRGTPGVAGTYNITMASEARAAWPFPGISDTFSACGPAQCAIRQTPGSCAVWCFSDALAGFVHLNSGDMNCFCPNAGIDPSWN